MMRSLALAILMAVSAAAGPAAAAEVLPPADQVVLSIREEAWVKTDTARVVAEIKTLITDETAEANAADPKAILEQVGLGDWHITGSYRQQTDTGFEQLLVVAETRMAQSALSGIYERAKSASEKGRTVRVLTVDFSPSLAEREATARELRRAIYARAAAEAKAVAAEFPEQAFRVHQVQFQNGGQMPRPMPVQARMMVAEKQGDSAAAEPPDQQVSERMVMSATVIIAAPGR